MYVALSLPSSFLSCPEALGAFEQITFVTPFKVCCIMGIKNVRLHELYKNNLIKGHEVDCSRLQISAVALHQLHPAAITCIVGGSIVNQSLVFLFDPSERDQRRD